MLDILMTILSVILMGGTMLFPDDRIHQICGIALSVLWAVHVVLNRKWYGSLFKGKYQPFRIMQLIVNCGVLICAVLLMISGLLMAWFIPADWVGVTLGFARTTHLLASHWYYIFMAFHIGLQQFFFFDFNRGYVLFALDYLSILVLFATVIHYIRKGISAKQ